MTYIHFYDAIQCLLPISPCFWGDGEEAQSNRAFFDAVKVAFSYSRNFSVCLRNQNSRKPTCLRPAPPRPRSTKRRVNWLPSGRPGGYVWLRGSMKGRPVAALLWWRSTKKKIIRKRKKKIWRKVKHEFLMMATLPGLQEDGWRSSKHPGRRF